MPDLDIKDFLDRMERMETRASEERGKQTAAFTAALDRQNGVNERGFNKIMWVGILGLLGILALAGVQVTYGGVRPADLNVTAATSAPAPDVVMGAAAAEPVPVDDAPVTNGPTGMP